MKKIYSISIKILISVCFILSFSNSVFAQTKEVTNVPVYVSDKLTTFSKPVINIDGSNYFPMRELLNSMGVTDNNILWDAPTKSVTFYANNQIIIYTINQGYVVVNGESKASPKPVIYNGSTYLPIRSVAENSGFKVSYDSKTKTTKLSK